MHWRRARLSTEQQTSTGSVKNGLLCAGHFKGESKKQRPWWKRIKNSQHYYTRLRNPAVLVRTTITAIAIFALTKSTGPRITISVATWHDHDIMAGTAKEFRVVFPKSMDHNLTSEHFNPPPMLPTKAAGHRNFGGLVFHPRVNSDEPITIRLNYSYDKDQDDSGDDRYQSESRIDDQDSECREVSWTRYSFPICNLAHEKLIERVENEGYHVSYLNSGSYRDAYKFSRDDPAETFVLKRMILDHLHPSDLSSINIEALILERLTPSPRVVDILGYCGTSVLLEAMASDLHTKIIIGDGIASQQELDELGHVHSLNNFTASEKLQISLDMIESLADLHGFAGGKIIHADTHIEQWLIAPDGGIKLNDFNNARLPRWNSKHNKYCEIVLVYGGIWRSPEEHSGDLQDESMDIYAYGNSIYTLLTGLWPYYDETHREISDETIRAEIIAGKRPFVDPRYRTRSMIEEGLVQIMEKCWAQKRKDRPTSFELVEEVRNLKVRAFRAGELKESSLIKIPIPAGFGEGRK